MLTVPPIFPFLFALVPPAVCGFVLDAPLPPIDLNLFPPPLQTQHGPFRYHPLASSGCRQAGCRRAGEALRKVGDRGVSTMVEKSGSKRGGAASAEGGGYRPKRSSG